MSLTTTALKTIATASILALGFGVSSASAQALMSESPAAFSDGAYASDARVSVERRGEFSGLPGVDISDGAGKVRQQGPGGLENNIGAIGMAAPSTSSANPLPLQSDTATSGGAFAVGR